MRTFVAVLGIALVGGIALQASATGSNGKEVLEWEVMNAVTSPFLANEGHPVRGVLGGGVPWAVRRARGELSTTGRLEIKVEGLVIPSRGNTNPSPQFRGVVNCLTPAQPDTGESVMTDPVDATTDGDAEIEDDVALPAPCVAPIVFVTNGAGDRWFAVTGR